MAHTSGKTRLRSVRKLKPKELAQPCRLKALPRFDSDARRGRPLFLDSIPIGKKRSEKRTIAPRLRKYRSFVKARAFARRLDLKTRAEWRAFCKGKLPLKGRLPTDIPAAPHQVYSDKGWQGFGFSILGVSELF
jgi:hypothetical protein